MSTTPYTFKANTEELKRLCTRTLSGMRNVRAAHESLWRDIRDNFEPDIGKALDDGNSSDRSAGRGDGQIVNSEPRILLQRLAAGMQSGITNPSQRWFGLSVYDPHISQRGSIKNWLSEATEIVSKAMSDSNLYPTLNQVYQHAGAIGTSASVVVRGDNPGEAHLELSDVGDFWLSENRRRRVDTLVRRIMMTAARVVEEFGEGWAPENVRNAAANPDATNEYEVFNLIRPNDGRDLFGDADKERPFVSVYWIMTTSVENNGILAVRSFGYNPIIAPRWTLGGGPYGNGCGKVGLGDAKELQTLERDKLAIIAQDATPTVLAPASMKGESILDNYPGGVVWYNEGADNGRPVGRLFETRDSVQGVIAAQAEVKARLGRIFYADLFAMMLQLNAQPKQMTAREVNELASEKIALLGPILTQMNTDLLDPLVEAFFAILYEDGIFPPAPEELEGLPISVSYQSVMHTEQVSTTKMRAIIKVLDVVGMVMRIQPDAVDKFDGDQTIDEVCSALPESSAVIRDDKAVEEIRALRQQQQAALAQAEQTARLAPGIGKGAKDLSETKVNGENALDMLLQQAQQGIAQ